MRSLVCFFVFVMACSLNAQTENYSVTNLKINTEYPHFGLMLVDDSKIVFTSYLLDKKGRPKKAQGSPILTIYQGELSNSGAITSVKPILIDAKQNMPFITSATFSPDRQKLYITTVYTSKNKPEGNFKATNFHIKQGAFKAGIGWTNFKVLSYFVIRNILMRIQRLVKMEKHFILRLILEGERKLPKGDRIFLQ
tara:strand:+ start:1162 stop:1746 length:585 start_codon:yes stop_codon:yes gene_type:complete